MPVLVGSPTVLINGKPAARWAPSGDLAACGSFLGDVKLAATRTVLIGGPGAPPGMSFSIGPDGSLRLGNSITVQGTDEFKAAVANRLQIIGNTKSGQAILNGIESSGKKMNMVEFTGPNSFAGPSDFQAATPAGQPVFYGNGKPALDASGKQLVGTGTGSDVTVKFNPNLTLPNKQDPSAPMPNDAILFHEMKHGDHQMNGDYDGSPEPGWTTHEEHTTIRDDPPSEADYLKERDYGWRRTSHGTDFEPNN